MDLSAETIVPMELTAGELSTVMFGLDELPHKQAKPIWDKINRALVQAAQPPEAEVEEAVEVEEKPKNNGRTKKKKEPNLDNAPPI